MSRRVSLAAILFAAMLLSSPGPVTAQFLDEPASEAEPGRVALPLSLWARLVEAVSRPPDPGPPPAAPFSTLARTLEGSFERGLLHGTLEVRLRILVDHGYLAVPVLDGSASLERVEVNGEEGSLRRKDGVYVLGVERSGAYDVRVSFYLGKQQDRFARQLRLSLPPAGPTRFSVHLPEQDIEPRLAAGVITERRPSAEGTQVEGYLDATGGFDLSWARRLTHRGGGRARTECVANALFTVHEAMVSGVAVFGISVLEGETDRVDLRLPPGLEVVRVEGDAILQWHTEDKAGDAEGASGDGPRLSLLLRHLVADRIDARVHFQYPVDVDAPVPLRLPLPESGVPLTGAAGVQAPTGLDVRVTSPGKAEVIDLRELPGELVRLTPSPLLLGFRFGEQPGTELAIARHAQVKLTGTIVDELESSTVLLEDGTEVTKLRLHVRNNSRQYLAVRLPPGAVLTHSLVDGHPVRPARADPADGGDGTTRGEAAGRLLFPLRQSEKVAPGEERWHVVRYGENLGDIAYTYYSNPQLWRRILEANRNQMDTDADLTPGMSLRIPTDPGVAVEESHFIIELAYKRRGEPLGAWGRVDVGLPELDVDAMKVLWHLYLPHAVTPLRFDANLTQYTSVRYDLFRRVRDFLRSGLGIGTAQAGARYRSILDQRKGIYQAEAERRRTSGAALSGFPLVGERYRFKRILAGKEPPAVTVWFVASSIGELARWLALGLAFLFGYLALRRRRWWSWGVLALVTGALVFAAHYVLGMHRLVVWGLDLALVAAILRLRGGALWRRWTRRLSSPWTVVRAFTVRNVASLVALLALLRFLLRFPAFLSLGGLVALFVAWRLALRSDARGEGEDGDDEEERAADGAGEEDAHAEA